MSQEDRFLQAILTSPEDAAPRLIYADWLEERGDPRAELLRLPWDIPFLSFIDWMARSGELALYLERHPELREPAEAWRLQDGVRGRLEHLGDVVDSGWLAFIDTLARPFHRFFFWKATGSQAFGLDELPFSMPIGTRGALVTFESAFRKDSSWEQGLGRDLGFFRQLRLGSCAYGAAYCPIHPFVCELKTPRRALTGADVISALNVREFRSEHLQCLETTHIPFPGYHPGTENDEIHNDPAEQNLFAMAGDQVKDGEPSQSAQASFDNHQALTSYVDGGQLWYVLLHGTCSNIINVRRRSQYVVLFAVGRSPHGNRLLGVVSHQICHNLCD